MTEFFANDVVTDFILLTLIFTQIPIIFIYATRMYCRMYLHFALARNPDWVAAHPQFSSHFRYEKTMHLFAYFISAISLASIVYYVFLNPDPGNIVPMMFLPQMAWLTGLMFYSIFLYFKVTRVIPLQDQRRTVLEDKSLFAYAPRWVVVLGYTGLLLTGGVYLWALISGTIPTGLATARLAGFSVILVLGTAVLLMALRRKHSEYEPIFGTRGRKIEVRLAVALFFLGTFVGLYRILGDFFDIHLFTTGAFFVVASVAVQGWILAMYNHPNIQVILK